MCGICGIVNFSHPGRADANVAREMVRAIRHRGPDDAGLLSAGPVAFGHSRLSIIDAAGGAQPMASDDESRWIVFSGEIYNHEELREKLRARGHRFRSRSDTEVILESYRAWGTDAFLRFNGQWALAIWDRRRKSVVLSRDRFGIRPLYYAYTDGSLVFASEIKALMCHPRLERALRPEGVAETLMLWAPRPEETVFRGIREIPPGSFATASAPGTELRISRYWRPEFSAQAGESGSDGSDGSEGTDEAAEIRASVSAAVRLRFERSDVPVGVYVSGGLDSAIIAAVLAQSGARFRAFSLSFEDEEFDESGHQDSLATHLGIAIDRVRVSRADIAATFPDVVYHAEQPLLRTAAAPLALLARHVRARGREVVLTGEGADELFGGYDLFREHLIRAGSVEAVNTTLYEWQRRSPLAHPGLARMYWDGIRQVAGPFSSHAQRWQHGSQAARFFDPAFAPASPRALYTATTAYLEEALPVDFRSWGPLEQAQYLELSLFFPGYLLSAQSDRMMMANAVEGRFPYLDPGVADLALKLPTNRKISRSGDEKHALKRSFAPFLPSDVLNRAKQPYRAPDAAAFFTGAGQPDWMLELTSPSAVARAGIFRPSMVTSLVEKCARSKGESMSRTDNQRLVGVLSTMLLHHLFIEQNPRDRYADANGARGLAEIRVERPGAVRAGA